LGPAQLFFPFVTVVYIINYQVVSKKASNFEFSSEGTDRNELNALS